MTRRHLHPKHRACRTRARVGDELPIRLRLASMRGPLPLAPSLPKPMRTRRIARALAAAGVPMDDARVLARTAPKHAKGRDFERMIAEAAKLWRERGYA